MEQKEEFKVMQTHGNYQAVQENQKQQDAKNKVKVPLNPETCEIPKMVFIRLFYTLL
jgi:stress response protein YsnF